MGVRFAFGVGFCGGDVDVILVPIYITCYTENVKDFGIRKRFLQFFCIPFLIYSSLIN